MIAGFIRFMLLLVVLLPFWSSAALFDQTPGFVAVNQAFAFDFSQQDKQITLKWTIKPGYYLYRQQIHITPQQATLNSWQLPAGKPYKDEFFGQSEIYSEDLTLPLTLSQTGSHPTITLSYQGCAAAGFCYPPETRTLPLSAITASEPQSATDNVEPLRTTPPFSPLWALLIGIGVAFTPCVLPMYPLISGIILGRERRLSLARAACLALIYVQGMAITYTLLGVMVAAAGLRFQAALQNPVLLMGLAGLFILLALSMFGAFSLQLPASVQTRLAGWSNRQQGGSLLGVALMGAIAGLICSPCTTAPLSAILLYIAQSGNLLSGASTLYLYALGMGLPLIAVTVFGNKLLLRRGPWMQTVKEGFGFVILALPLLLLERVVGDNWSLRLWSLWALAAAGWALIGCLRSQRTYARWLALVWMLIALVAVRPLQDWIFSPSTQQVSSTLPFAPITSQAQLKQRLTENPQRITMLDLYADWCVACKEFEKYTFADSRVQQAMARLQLLQANVTKNSVEDNQLLTSLEVLGLPTILFFDQHGQEIRTARISGYMDAQQFLDHLAALPAVAGK